MTSLLNRFKERKLVQWGVAYLAGAWLTLQVAGELRDTFNWPPVVLRVLTVLVAVGFCAALVLAWYHGEKGRQRVSAVELLMLAGILIAAGALVNLVVGGTRVDPASAKVQTTTRVDSSVGGPEERSIAVLPFVNTSPERDQEYFSDGITDELLNALGNVEGLKVAARTSSFSFKGKNVAVDSVARALNVAYVLEGSVRKQGNRIRITTQLTEAASGYNLWSNTYSRDLTDIFAVQDEIARAIVGALRIQLAGAGATRPLVQEQTDDQAAYELYLRGRYLWNRRTEAALSEAVELLQQAVRRAPDFAQAHLGLADAYAVMGFYDYLPPQKAFPAAKMAARRALALDPSLSAAHATLGYAALYYDWDWTTAEAQFRRAIELEPRYPVAHQWYGNLLLARGRFAEAERELFRARELDPLSLIAGAAHGWVHYHAGRYERAIEILQRVLELDPTYAVAYLWLGNSYGELNRSGEAGAAYRRAVQLSDGANAIAALARWYALLGERDEALALLRRLEDRGRYAPPYELAKIYLSLGDRERAFSELERAYRDRSHSLVFLRIDPQLRPIHSDPRFAAVAANVGV